jgi:hypothetical protein
MGEDSGSEAATNGAAGDAAGGSAGGASAPDTMAAGVMPMDGGADESSALASEAAAMADAAEKEKAAGKDAKFLLDVVNQNKGWIGLLALFLIIVLVAAVFRQAARESERKRQEREWQEAKDNVIDLRAVNPDLDAAA